MLGPALAALAISFSVTGASHAQGGALLTHVHGLEYSADGKQLLIPSHHGLAIYSDGSWRKAPGPAHDYMGFSATGTALYSSGHPAPGSGLVNPFGLIKSSDGGKTWRRLGLEGETDFHLLATGWRNNAVYVVNPAPSSKMPAPGLHRTLDDGTRWERASAAGLPADVKSLAVHPDDAATVAVGTGSGLYVSRDGGATFVRRVGAMPVLAIEFTLDGKGLWFGSHDGRARLMHLALDPSASPQPLALPALTDDAVAYIAQNPARPAELAVATFHRDVWLSADRGRNWRQIAARGEAK
jgi:hypothetical protein